MKQQRWRRLFLALFAFSGIVLILVLPRIWGDLIYPLDYEVLILDASEEYQVSPTLVAAVIYTESRFNHQAISRVGARGLMQIMPATGQGIAKRLGDTSFTTDHLFDPATNIRYGTYYLRYLLDRYDNEIDLALAAYNGGGAAANRFRESPHLVPSETLGYVSKVQRSELRYRELYGESLGKDIANQLKEETPPTLWQRVFGWLFNPES